MASRRLVPCLWRPLSLTGATAKGSRGWPAAWAPPSSSRTAASVGAAVTHPLLRPGAPAPALSTTHARHFISKTNPSFAARPALAEEETVEATEDEKAPTIPDAVSSAVAAATAPGAAACYPLLDAQTVIAAPSYTRAYVESITPTHLPPTSTRQKLAHALIQAVRTVFDKVTGYDPHGSPSEAAWLRRIIFLETVAGVPGMVGGAIRHLQSLRLMRYDGGWIADLLAESENERMHLCTFMELRKPGPLFRAAVLVAQGVFWNMYFCTYLASPKTAHSMVGYLEEEAVKTYTHALAEIDAGRLWADGTVKVPKIAKHYWSLPHGCTMRDLVLAVRADEWDHARVNHTFSLIPDAAPNPFAAAKNSSTAVKGSVGGKQEL